MTYATGEEPLTSQRTPEHSQTQTMSKRRKNPKPLQKLTAFFLAMVPHGSQNGADHDAAATHNAAFTAISSQVQHPFSLGEPEGSSPPESPTTRSPAKSCIRRDTEDPHSEIGPIHHQALFLPQPAIADFPAGTKSNDGVTASLPTERHDTFKYRY